MTPHLGRQSIIVLNSTEGAPGRYETAKVDADPVVVERCSLQALRTEREDRDSTDVVLARFELFTPPAAPVRPTSKVRLVTTDVTADSYTIASKVYHVTKPTYDVDGEVAIWPDRNGRLNHLECYLKERRP